MFHVLLAKWNVPTTLRSVSVVFELLIPLQVGCSLEKAPPRCTFSKMEFSHSCRISLILLHMFRKYFIIRRFSASLWSQNLDHICIQLVAVIVLHLFKTLLHLLPGFWLSLCIKFVLYMNFGFSLDTDTLTWLLGARPRASKNKWDMTLDRTFSCLCDEFKHKVNGSGSLQNAMQIVPELNCSQDDVAGSRQPLQVDIYIHLGCPPYWQSPEPSTHPSHLCNHIAFPLTIYSILPSLVWSYEHLVSKSESLTTIENQKCNEMPHGCRNQSSHMLIPTRSWLTKSSSGLWMVVLESANGQHKPSGLGRRRLAWQRNRQRMKWGSKSRRLPSPLASATN